MIEDFKTLIWFLTKPSLYPALIDLILRKFFLTDHDSESCKNRAKQWCLENKTEMPDIFLNYKLKEISDFNDVLTDHHFQDVKKQIMQSDSDFGGPGDLNLLFNICESIEATSVLETGVAYGWSSAAILESIHKRHGTLVSIDMPMPKQTNYELIGLAVRDNHRKFWKLIRKPDKYGLLNGLRALNNKVDVVHYDSDKSYYGRKWAYPKIYNSLVKGGFLISDDIEDNLGFRDFVESMNLDYTVHSIDGKFVGIIKK
jgi:predicted O-methyltransferase YrrM